MMTQLQLGGVLEQISGFIFGKCNDCEPGGSGYGSLTLEEVVDHYIKPLNIPAFSGAMIGHIANNVDHSQRYPGRDERRKGHFKTASAGGKLAF